MFIHFRLAQHVSGIIMPIVRRQNKHLYLCHPLVLSSPTLMMHGHMNLKSTKAFCQSHCSTSFCILCWYQLVSFVVSPRHNFHFPFAISQTSFFLWPTGYGLIAGHRW